METTQKETGKLQPELGHRCAALAGTGRSGTATWAAVEIYNQAGLGVGFFNE